MQVAANVSDAADAAETAIELASALEDKVGLAKLLQNLGGPGQSSLCLSHVWARALAALHLCHFAYVSFMFVV